MTARNNATATLRQRTIRDATCSLPETLRSLDRLVGAATARFQVQCEVMREAATDLDLLDAQLGEFIQRAPLGSADAAFLMRAGLILRQTKARLQAGVS
jgi:hypothetical protein